MQDTDLMLRVRAGEDSAFREIVERYQEKIIGLCFRYVGNQIDAEELAQEVFIRLYKAAPTYEVKGKLSTFLYRIAVNLSLNAVRDRKRKQWLSLDRLKSFSVDHTPSEEAGQPDIIFERLEIQQSVRKAIDSLPEGQRTAVILKRYQGMSYEEIAGVMNCSVSSVEARLHRAKQTLKRKLKDLSE